MRSFAIAPPWRRKLRDALGFDLPGFASAHIEDSDLTTIVPAAVEADLVIALRGEKAKLGIIVEVQLAPDDDKPSSWLVYVANLHAKLRAPVVLLIVTPSEQVVRWCSRRLPFVQPSLELRPFVLGPQDVPIVENETVAVEAPELAVLSALAHAQGDDAFAVGRAALRAISLHDDNRAKLHCDLVLSKSAASYEVASWPRRKRYSSSCRPVGSPSMTRPTPVSANATTSPPSMLGSLAPPWWTGSRTSSSKSGRPGACPHSALAFGPPPASVRAR